MASEICRQGDNAFHWRVQEEMLRRKYFLVVVFAMLVLTLVLGACAQGAPEPQRDVASGAPPGTSGGFDGEGDFAAEEPAAPSMGGDMDTGSNVVPQQGGEGQQQIDRLIIRTGSISAAVDDTRDAQEKIEQLVNSMADQGGFVVSTNISGGSTDVSPYISMTIRVPSERFDEVMDAIAALAAEGTVPTMNQSGQDVTEEYVDLAARLESLEAARERLQEIMANAQTTEELLQAESQLTQREAEIESIKGRMQYLSQSAALSSISIELSPYILSQPVDTRWKPAETIRRALEDLVESLRGFADFAIYTVIACGPWLIILGLVGFFGFRFIRSQLRKRRGDIIPPANNNP
jgi:hypothetical protein